MLNAVNLQGILKKNVEISVPVSELEKGLWEVAGLSRVYEVNIACLPVFSDYIYQEESEGLFLCVDIGYHGSIQYKKCDNGHITDPRSVELYHILLDLHHKLIGLSRKEDDS